MYSSVALHERFARGKVQSITCNKYHCHQSQQQNSRSHDALLYLLIQLLACISIMGCCSATCCMIKCVLQSCSQCTCICSTQEQSVSHQCANISLTCHNVTTQNANESTVYMQGQIRCTDSGILPATLSTGNHYQRCQCNHTISQVHLPLTASARRRARKPPSSAGRGSALTTARLMFTMAANWNKPDRSDLAISEPTATIATGPVKFSEVLAKLVKIC